MTTDEALFNLRYGVNGWEKKLSIWLAPKISGYGRFRLMPVPFRINYIDSFQNLFHLNYEFNSTNKIYYFRYSNGTEAPEYTIVPRNSKIGTLVCTDGMNGCSILIITTKKYFIFIHDNTHQLNDNNKLILSRNLNALLRNEVVGTNCDYFGSKKLTLPQKLL